MVSNNPNWTPESIAALLDRNDVAVERAVLAIYRRQTDDEQESDTTKHCNGVGFNGVHAHLGSYYARWIQSGRHLTGNHLDKARRMMRRYVRQLAEVASAHTVKESSNVQ